MSAEAGILVEADTAFALGIVLTELITNAVEVCLSTAEVGNDLCGRTPGRTGAA